MAEKNEKKVVETKEVEIVMEKESPEKMIFNEVLKNLNEKLKDKEINVSNLMFIVQNTMEVVELSKAKGEDQKDLAVKLIEKIVVDAPISDSTEKLILDMIEQGVVGSTIDLVIAATKGELNINKASKVAMSCWEFIKNKLKR